MPPTYVFEDLRGVLLDHVLRADLMLTGLANDLLLFAGATFIFARLLAASRRVANGRIEFPVLTGGYLLSGNTGIRALRKINRLLRQNKTASRTPLLVSMTRRLNGQQGTIGIYGSTNVSPISRRAMRAGVSRSATWKRLIGSPKSSKLRRKV